MPDEFWSSELDAMSHNIHEDKRVHPLTGESRRFVCGDRFHSKSNPHKSPLCAYQNIDLCLQALTIKTSYQESQNKKKNTKRNRSSCMQSISTHIFYNYLIYFYENEEIVLKQQRELKESTGQNVIRDEYMRFKVDDSV